MATNILFQIAICVALVYAQTKQQFQSTLKMQMVEANKDSDFGQMEVADILSQLPLCVATCKKANDCKKTDFGSSETDALRKNRLYIDAYFQALNNYNDGKTIQKAGAGVVLWSGMAGEAKARELAAASGADHHHFAIGGTDPHTTIEHLYVDTEIAVLQDAFSVIDSSDADDTYHVSSTYPEGSKANFRTFLCMWLIYNSETTSGIKQYSSIGAYEAYIPIALKASGHKGWANAGRTSVWAGKVTKAFLVGSYFWNVEMVAIAKKNPECVVDVYLMKYDIALSKAVATTVEGDSTVKLPEAIDWDTKVDLFKVGIPNLKIIFRAPNDHDQFYVSEADDLHKLIDLYNAANSGNTISKTGRLTASLPNLIKFVDWTQTYTGTKKPASWPAEPTSAHGGYRNVMRNRKHGVDRQENAAVHYYNDNMYDGMYYLNIVLLGGLICFVGCICCLAWMGFAGFAGYMFAGYVKQKDAINRYQVTNIRR